MINFDEVKLGDCIRITRRTRGVPGVTPDREDSHFLQVSRRYPDGRVDFSVLDNWGYATVARFLGTVMPVTFTGATGESFTADAIGIVELEVAQEYVREKMQETKVAAEDAGRRATEYRTHALTFLERGKIFA